MNPGDLIVIGKKVWKCTGSYLGGTGTQSFIALESVTQKAGYAGSLAVKTMYVPLEFIELMSTGETPIVFHY